MKIIFVHGRAQGGKDPVKLKQEWVDALYRGMEYAHLNLPSNLKIEFPFYGDKLDQLVKEFDVPLVDDVRYRGDAQDLENFDVFRGETLYEIAHGAGISDEEILTYYEGNIRERGPRNWEWVQAILKALEKTPLGEKVIDLITRDAYVYLKFPAVQSIINSMVAENLTNEQCVVVGHSLGSVVAYNILRQKQADTSLIKFVTLGSPLGMQSFKNNLETPLRMPHCVHDWFNAMDERDVVALYPLNEIHFPVTPPIRNKTSVDNRTPDRHGIIGYLEDVDVAKNIFEGL